MNLQPAIDQLTAEIERMTSARAALQALNGGAAPRKPTVKAPAKVTLSAEARRKIGAATRARWAAGKMGKQSLNRKKGKK